MPKEKNNGPASSFMDVVPQWEIDYLISAYGIDGSKGKQIKDNTAYFKVNSDIRNGYDYKEDCNE